VKDFIPLFQTIVWALIVLFTIFLFWEQIQLFKKELTRRLAEGGLIRIGPIELGELVKEQKRQATEIEWVQTLATLLVSEYELKHLEYFNSDSDFIASVKQGSSFEWELRHLLTLNFLERKQGKGMRTLFRAGKCNLKDHLRITDRGKKYIAILEESKGETPEPVKPTQPDD